MDKFVNVTVIARANCYYGGKVTSRTILLPTGEKKTLGIILPGEYEFSTADKEIMEILSGYLEVLLPDSADWTAIVRGQSFEVPANSTFRMRVKEIVDYICSYIKDESSEAGA